MANFRDRFFLWPKFLKAMLVGIVVAVALNAKANTSVPELNWYDQALAYLLNKGIVSSGYSFQDTVLVSTTDPQLELTGVLSIGEILVLNEKMSRELAPNEFAATVRSRLKVRDEAAGDVLLRWHPSQGFLAMATGMLMYRLDRAYLSPDWLRNWKPEWFEPKARSEPFELEWNHLKQLLEMKRPKSELRFLINVIKEMQLLNPDVDSGLAQGKVTYFADAKTNHTIFIYDIKSQFDGALACRQTVRTDFNPFTKEFRKAQGRLRCDWPDEQKVPAEKDKI